jgi:hypothetical protein
LRSANLEEERQKGRKKIEGKMRKETKEIRRTERLVKK